MSVSSTNSEIRYAPCWRSALVASLTGGFAYLLFLMLLPGFWRQNWNPDYLQFYEPVARNLISGKGLVTPDGAPLLLYPPGYPMILGGIFGVARALGCSEVIALQAFTFATVVLSTLLIYAIGSRFFGNRVAIIAALAWGTYPFQLWLTKQPNVDSPFMVLLLLIVLVLARALDRPQWSMWLAASEGILVGAASLIKPTAILLCIVLVLAVWGYAAGWSRSAKVKFTLVLLAGNLLAVLPWEWWAHGKTGDWIPLSVGNGPASILDGLTFAAGARGSGMQLQVPADVGEMMVRIQDQIPRLRTTVDIARCVAGEFRSQPLAAIKLFGLKAARAWYATNAQWYEIWILILQVPYLALAIAGLTSAFRNGERQRRVAGIILLVTLYFWGMTVLVLSILRHMVPVMGLLMMPAAVAAYQAGGWFVGLARRRAAARP